MTKFVIDTIELIKKQYVVEAYLPDDALELRKERAPVKVKVLSDIVFDIHSVNEYEYNQKWKPLDPDIGPDQLKDQQKDWVYDEPYSFSGKSSKAKHEKKLLELEPSIWRDD